VATATFTEAQCTQLLNATEILVTQRFQTSLPTVVSAHNSLVRNGYWLKAFQTLTIVKNSTHVRAPALIHCLADPSVLELHRKPWSQVSYHRWKGSRDDDPDQHEQHHPEHFEQHVKSCLEGGPFVRDLTCNLYSVIYDSNNMYKPRARHCSELRPRPARHDSLSFEITLQVRVRQKGDVYIANQDR
jgi:hypothetical protein